MVLNVQADLRSRLAKAFDGVKVAVSVPSQIPSELIVVRREGGGRLNSTQDAPGVGIDVWATSEARACELAQMVSDFMHSLSFADGYESVDEEVLCSQYDVVSKRPHWYASYSLITHKPTY